MNEVKKFKIECPVTLANDRVQAKIQEYEDFLNGIEDTELAETLYNTLVRCFESLKRLDDGSMKLFTDFAPLSFFFQKQGLCGGVIYHGPIDGFGSGSAPTYAVCAEPFHGWQIHT